MKSLLDRLSSDVADPPLGYEDSVLRDLEWLFNASSPMSDTPPEVLARYPRVADSVLNFGLRNVFGHVLHDLTEIEQEVASALARFEPRLKVQSQKPHLTSGGQLIEIEIRGTLLDNGAQRSLWVRTDLRTLNSRLREA
jgi:predicted component of type VI protein secretion system